MHVVSGGTTEQRADAALPSAAHCLGASVGSAELLALTVQPVPDPSSSASLESLPQLSCLHVPHSARAFSPSFKAGTQLDASGEPAQPVPLWEAQHCALEPVTLQALGVSLGTLIPSDLGLFLGQFSHQRIGF